MLKPSGPSAVESDPILRNAPSADNGSILEAAQAPTRHGRSISYPLPSLFSHSEPTSMGEVEARSAPNPNQTARVGEHRMATPKSMSGCSTTGRTSENDTITGRCSTCNSTVRFPQAINAYRCTECLMINDLKPAQPEHSFPRTLSGCTSSSTGSSWNCRKLGKRTSLPRDLNTSSLMTPNSTASLDRTNERDLKPVCHGISRKQSNSEECHKLWGQSGNFR